ncbi:DUF3151 domain-containing protein [Corynebacterium sp. 11A]|uniref:DUF3151 domain-containing protein n=1 Tax=Corynebacterium sp. 11A TaxID=2080510 RepID=UPI00124E8FB4|nr:DUF3151 domain-containing protein [Corynebacterium sp. 11A]
MTQFKDMLAPPPLHLPEDPAADAAGPLVSAVLNHPESPLLWAQLAEEVLATAESDSDRAQAYAYARTGYHRGLDRLRAHGWKGWGPLPYSHEPNRGVLRAIAALARVSAMIDDTAEYERCEQMLKDADPEAAATLLH